MSDNIKLPNVENPYDWLKSLPQYQQHLLGELLHNSTPEEAAKIWLDASVQNNSPFGTDNNKSNYFYYVSEEIRKLLCGGVQYNEERDDVKTLLRHGGSKESFVASLSAWIGSQLGVSTVFIAPAIVLILMIISKISLNAWCNMKRDKEKTSI